MSKAGERVVDKFSDLSQECAECLIDFDQKQWVISVPFQEVVSHLVWFKIESL